MSGLAVACLVTLLVSEAAATANLGGAISVIAGSGLCTDNKLVPANTSQDTFALSGAAACSGGSATVDLRADAATGSVGLRGSSSGNGFGSSSAAGQVSFVDHWLFNVPTGTAPGIINIPVAIKLEGSISPGAVMDSVFNRFLDYGLSITDLYSSQGLIAFDKVATTGDFSQTFNGSVNFNYFGPLSALPMTADVEMQLTLVSLLEGTVDFLNTASISMSLPQGFSATTSSGLPLVFAPPEPSTPSVPEPSSILLLASGLAGLGGMAWRRARRK